MHNLESIQLLIFSGLDSKLQEIGLKTWYFGILARETIKILVVLLEWALELGVVLLHSGFSNLSDERLEKK